jgi:hypothetical protein
MRTIPYVLMCLTAAALVVGCSDDGSSDADSIEVQTDDTDADATDADGATDDDADDDGAADETDDAASAPADELVDTTRAEPGTWPVGDAGTVTFDVVEGALTLEGYQAADGWTATVDEEESDEIEVDFTRDAQRWEFEVEIDDGRLEVEIRLDDTDASAGSYDLPDGGSFAFDANGALTLTDVSPGEGWTVTEQEQESDELEIDLRNEDRRVDVEVELDDGRIEVELDYEVVGPLPA